MNRPAKIARLTLIGLGSSALAYMNLQPSAQGMPALAQELQGKPVVVNIYASWCSSCQRVEPTLSSLKQQYSGKANFVQFDVSDRKRSQSSLDRASQLGLGQFFQVNKAQTSLVAIVNPKTGAVIQEFRGNSNLQEYKTALNSAINQIKK
jgi:thiol-disulfide isomerase/thioredoxin